MAFQNLGDVVRRLFQLKRQYKIYREWIARWGSMPVSAWIVAAEHYQRGEFENAARFYERGLRTHANSPATINALLDLSHCLFRLRRFEEAEQYLRQATSKSSTDREPYVRLARLQLWLGYASEAVWTMRMCLQKLPSDPELVTLFVTAVVESGGARSAVVEARDLLKELHYEAEAFPRLEVAKVRLSLLCEDSESARDELSKLASIDRGPFEAVVAFAELLIREGKLSYARHHLHRSLVVAPDHPKVLRLLATTYLKEGCFFEPAYAVQLAEKACQVTAWSGVEEMATLTRAYVATGEKVAALLVATKAKDVVARLLGVYPEVEQLEHLLQRDIVETPAH